MDRTERLLNLVAFFLDAKTPVSLEDIRDAFPDDYSGSADASQRKFERDKAELQELGIPLKYTATDDFALGGYTLDHDAYYLPEPGLTPEELAVLYAAGSAALASGAFPGRQDLAHALRKLGFFADGPLPAAHVRLELASARDAKELPARLEALWDALNARKSVDLDYYSPRTRSVTSRRIDPYGLALRRGVWNLVGWCHLRKGLRTFHVHRIRALRVNTAKPKQPDFIVPAGFKVDDHVASWPWEHQFHEPVEVQLSLGGELRPLAQQLFGVAPKEEADRALVTISATNLDGLVTWVLSLGADARIVSPERARTRLTELATKVLAAHGGAA
ncbi:MAG: helix-turn-helix transcriptional regulator [Myxococcota bacterium]